ncbi:glycosyltransferase family 2 protein [Vibrio vulnificus]|uniref:glycosyltransferase family 2 protein n=1 Tax=Vibrio vulnificus TaxID=672 RepID=UPI0024E03BB5|nr:glycosyltransferase family 2 protein [Vibrio vulnificus]MDK2638482.1 glycosyltransferase family 2 protein [Vibrio vulnificus]MDK2646839.1 glycosyltransferase family 2 protein [Vibrio vulnificus]MDK2664684.1 glycosyltransferase family 2 protein [Vibrio vulnificus]MDK2690497.1 glycosyltransferase family 2 protein [Vibrio vulnificus]
MKVSVITATYNSSQTIVDTVRSLEGQTYSDIEYIIVDGASKDNTLQVIEQNCSRVSKIISEPDRGIYDALNKGIQAATGDVIGFLHSDDLLAYPQAIADLVNTMQASQSQAVYADLEYVSKDDISKTVRLWTSGEYQKQNLLNGWMPPHPTFYMRRECYQALGVFDLSFRISADYDSLLRYLWLNSVTMSYLPKVLIKMRVGGASNRSLSNIYKKSCEDIRALKNSQVFWPKALLIKNVSKIPQFFRR